MEDGSITELTALLRRADEEAELRSRQGYEDYWREPRTMERHLAGLLEIYEQVEGWPG